MKCMKKNVLLLFFIVFFLYPYIVFFCEPFVFLLFVSLFVQAQSFLFLLMNKSSRDTIIYTIKI